MLIVPFLFTLVDYELWGGGFRIKHFRRVAVSLPATLRSYSTAQHSTVFYRNL